VKFTPLVHPIHTSDTELILILNLSGYPVPANGEEEVARNNDDRMSYNVGKN